MSENKEKQLKWRDTMAHSGKLDSLPNVHVLVVESYTIHAPQTELAGGNVYFYACGEGHTTNKKDFTVGIRYSCAQKFTYPLPKLYSFLFSK